MGWGRGWWVRGLGIGDGGDVVVVVVVDVGVVDVVVVDFYPVVSSPEGISLPPF